MRPLTGVRVLVTRASDQVDSLQRRLVELGAEVMVYPAIATRGWDDPSGWTRFAGAMDQGGWLVFTSENGVRFFFEQLPHQCADVHVVRHFRTAAVGVGTAESLLAHGLEVEFMPARATGEDFAREFAAQTPLKGTVVVRVRGTLADDRLDRAVAAAGAAVVPLTVYETYHPLWSVEMKQALFATPPDVIIFASGSAVEGLFANLTADEIHRILSPGLLVSIGPSTSAVMRHRGLTVGLEATRHTVPDLVNELAAYAAENPIRRKQ